jgi:beta-phosphoglucomutase
MKARLPVKAVIFDLDGVVVATDEYHYQAWQRLADEEGICFDRALNQRLRGVSRMESLEILLERSPRDYARVERLALADRKNGYYLAFLRAKLTPGDVLPGALKFMEELRTQGVKLALASSSRNCRAIVERIGLRSYFDATVDGNDIKRGKPHPEVFLLTAERLGIAPGNCVVVEDAGAGVEAALRAGMRVVGVGFAAGDERATMRATALAALSVEKLLAL